MTHRISSLFLTAFVLAGIISCNTSSLSNEGTVLGDSLWIKGVEDIICEKNVNYLGELTPEKRFVSLGFDDFRTSDFSLIIPILNKYDAKAEFNRIHFSADVTEQDRERIQILIDGGHELGDHTWRHFSFIFDEPLFNGQDPDCLDGNQVPFPSNSQLRDNTGGVKMCLDICLQIPSRKLLVVKLPILIQHGVIFPMMSVSILGSIFL